jgi:hypothetical protein
VKIVDLVGRDRRSLEQRESDVREGPRLRSPAREILAVHEGEVSAGAAEGDTVSPIVRAHAREVVAPRNSAFEMEDVGRLLLWPR